MKAQLMLKKFATTCLIIGTLVAPAVTFAADKDTDPEHPLVFVKDSEITTKIKARLVGEKMSSLWNIRVETDNKGTVVLSGTAKTKEAAEKALSIAHETEGVTSVKSSLTVKND